MPKKKLVKHYVWHRVPQYARERSQSVDDTQPETEQEDSSKEFIVPSPSPTPSSSIKKNETDDDKSLPLSSSSNIHRRKSTPCLFELAIRKNRGLWEGTHGMQGEGTQTRVKNQSWSFGVAEKAEIKVSDLVIKPTTERRQSPWILVDDIDDDNADDDDDGKDDERKSRTYSKTFNELPIESIILPEDRARLNCHLFWKDESKFLKEIEIILNIHVRNWYALHGDGRRVWKLPTTVHSWWGEWGTFLSYYYDPLYWIGRYPSHIPGRAWDSAISSNSALEAYFEMRRKAKAPTFLSWTCEGIDARDERRTNLWSYNGYSTTPNKFDFQVQVEILPGEKMTASKKRSKLAYIWGEDGFKKKWEAFTHFLLWGDGLEIRHYRDQPTIGGAYTDVLELPFVTLHNKFPELQYVLHDDMAQREWQVYRHFIEDNPNIDPELDVVHAYTNYDVRGGAGAQEYYGGQQYVITDRFQEDFDEPSGNWWYFPRNYRYEMQRGLGHITDTYKRTRAPLYERMVEFSSVGYANDPKPPWRKGAFQNLGWFLDQFLFHFLPYLRRTKVALDLVTRPFSYRETSLSRLDGTFWLLSRSCRILSKSRDFSGDSKSWDEFRLLVDTAGKEITTGMENLLSSIDPIRSVLRKVNYRLAWASMRLEAAQSHWRILVGRSYYLLGLFRFDILHGLFYNRHFKDRYYGVPGLYSSSRHKSQLDPYNEFCLEQFPLIEKVKNRNTEGSVDEVEGEEDEDHIPGSETPPKPSFVPWDDEESTQRVPYNFYWLGSDTNCHIHLPLENRCIPLGTLGKGEKTQIFSSLFKNVQDMLDLAKRELNQAQASIYKYTDEKDVVFMSPTGPVGPKDHGYQNLLNLLHNPQLVNPLDTTPLQTFDTLLSKWFDVVGQVTERSFRHMLGPGAYRLSQSVEQIFDLYQEVHLILPHIVRMKTFLKTNLNLIRGLSLCENRTQVMKFVLGTRIGKHGDILGPMQSSLLRMKNQAFYVVRFSMSPSQNEVLARRISPEVDDTLEKVEESLEEYYYIKNRHYEGYVKARAYRGRLSRGRLRLKMDRNRARTHLITLRGQHDLEDYYRNRIELSDNPVVAATAVRRFSSANLFYLEDDRPEHIGRYGIGKRYRPKDKIDIENFHLDK